MSGPAWQGGPTEWHNLRCLDISNCAIPDTTCPLEVVEHQCQTVGVTMTLQCSYVHAGLRPEAANTRPGDHLCTTPNIQRHLGTFYFNLNCFQHVRTLQG